MGVEVNAFEADSLHKDEPAKYKDLSETDKEFFVKIWKNIIKVAKLNIENYLPKRKDKDNKKKQTV